MALHIQDKNNYDAVMGTASVLRVLKTINISSSTTIYLIYWVDTTASGNAYSYTELIPASIKLVSAYI